MADTKLTLLSDLTRELRPELHRYCSRMTGNIFEGEDVVQETLSKAASALDRWPQPPPSLKPWLFRIAHNTAIDFMRRKLRFELVAELPEVAMPDDEHGVDHDFVAAAISVFVELPPVQRSTLILKDVLGYSLIEIASMLEISVGAVKAALSRARANVSRSAEAKVPHRLTSNTAALQRYATLFNQRDWGGLRLLLTEDSKLDLVARLKNRVIDAKYFVQYTRVLQNDVLHADVGFVGTQPVIGMFRGNERLKPAYLIAIDWAADGTISLIRDFYYAPYIVADARFEK